MDFLGIFSHMMKTARVVTMLSLFQYINHSNFFYQKTYFNIYFKFRKFTKGLNILSDGNLLCIFLSIINSYFWLMGLGECWWLVIYWKTFKQHNSFYGYSCIVTQTWNGLREYLLFANATIRIHWFFLL